MVFGSACAKQCSDCLVVAGVRPARCLLACLRHYKLYFFNLQKIEFDGGFATENGNQHPEFTMFFVDAFDRAKKVVEGTVGDFDGFAEAKVGFELGGAQSSKLHNSVYFRLGQGGGFGAHADEAGDALGGSDNQPGIVVYNHFDEQIAGKDFFLDGVLFAVLDVDFILGRDEDLENFVGLAKCGNALAEGFGDPGLVAGIGVDDVPAAGLGQLFGGVGIDYEVAGDGFAAQTTLGDGCSDVICSHWVIRSHTIVI